MTSAAHPAQQPPTPRSKRTQVLENRPVNLDGFVEEWPEVGLVAMDSPFDPEPGVRVEDGVIVEMDGRRRADFDFLDRFIADRAIDAEVAEEAMGLPAHEIANMLLDPHVARSDEGVSACRTSKGPPGPIGGRGFPRHLWRAR